MNEPERQIMSILGEAVEYRSPRERAAFLDKACAGDPDRRARLEDLLRAYDAAGNFLGASSSPEPSATANQASAETAGTIIGPYKLLEQIGEGGMGTVWMAQQTEPVKRVVALKLIKAGMDSKAVIARFEAERQALALMEHPNIARVLDAGATSAGRPYFVMDLVKGVPITRYCDEHHLTPRQRLELFLPICQAIQHAHQKGIIHRDLKPSNVLVALYDGKPVPKVIDFGVAKAAGQPLTEQTLVTGFGAIVGTLEYMSPEQAEINQLDIDTRSDIYSLGVLLYELLTGSPPFTRKDLEKAGMLEMLRVIREEEPSKPSTKLSTAEGLPTLAANRGTEPAKLTKLVRGELDWIVMKALEKDRSRRYETANGFAMDVQRYLADEPVLACPRSAAYRLRKFARRNKASLAVAGLVLLFLVLLGSGVGWAVRDREARKANLNRETELALREAEETRDTALTLTDNPYQWEAALATAFAALKRAEGIAAQDQAALEPAIRERLHSRRLQLEEDESDRRFATRIEEIRLAVAETFEDQGDYARFKMETAYPELQEALKAHYGLTIGETPIAQVLRVIQERPQPVQEFLITAFSECAAKAPKSDRQARKWLSAMLEATDTDPWWRQARNALAARDWPALEALMTREEVARQSAPKLLHLVNQIPSEASATELNLLRRIQHAHPGDFWATYRLGHALAQMWWKVDAYDEAVRYLTAAVSLRPRTASAYVQLGIALRDKGLFDEAIDRQRQALRLNPNHPLARRDLALVLKGIGRVDEAIAEYRESLRLYPSSVFARHNLSVALRVKERWGEAEVESREAVRLKPDFAITHAGLAQALSHQDKFVEAEAESREAIRLHPDKASYHTCLGYVLYRQRKVGEAIECYRKAIKLDPKFALAYNNLGAVLRDQGKWDEAIVYWLKAKESLVHGYDPARTYVTENLRKAAWQLAHGYDPKIRNPVLAVELAKEAVELAPQSLLAWQYLGWFQYQAGNWKASIEALEKSCEVQKGGDCGQWIVMSLAHWKLAEDQSRHRAEARRLYEVAVKQIDRWKSRPNDDVGGGIWDFRAEALKLIGPNAEMK